MNDTPGSGSGSAAAAPSAPASTPTSTPLPGGSGSGASAPAAPAAAPGAQPAPPASGAASPTPGKGLPDTVDTSPASALNFDELFGTPGGEDSPIPAVVPPAPVAPVVAPTPAPVVAAAAPAAPATVAPADAPAPTGAPGPQASPPNPAEPASLARALSQGGAEIIKTLAANDFKLTAEEASGLETNPVEVIQTLMAKTFLRAQQAALMTMATVIPAMMKAQTAVSGKSKETMDAFFGQFPNLNPKDHGATINRIAVAYRQANPNAPQDQAIREVGAMVMSMVGSQPPSSANGVAASTGAPLVRAPQPSPFVPAGSASPVSSPQPVQGNPWDILGMNPEE